MSAPCRASHDRAAHPHKAGCPRSGAWPARLHASNAIVRLRRRWVGRALRAYADVLLQLRHVALENILHDPRTLQCELLVELAVALQVGGAMHRHLCGVD